MNIFLKNILIINIFSFKNFYIFYKKLLGIIYENTHISINNRLFNKISIFINNLKLKIFK